MINQFGYPQWWKPPCRWWCIFQPYMASQWGCLIPQAPVHTPNAAHPESPSGRGVPREEPTTGRVAKKALLIDDFDDWWKNTVPFLLSHTYGIWGIQSQSIECNWWLYMDLHVCTGDSHNPWIGKTAQSCHCQLASGKLSVCYGKSQIFLGK